MVQTDSGYLGKRLCDCMLLLLKEMGIWSVYYKAERTKEECRERGGGGGVEQKRLRKGGEGEDCHCPQGHY